MCTVYHILLTYMYNICSPLLPPSGTEPTTEPPENIAAGFEPVEHTLDTSALDDVGISTEIPTTSTPLEGIHAHTTYHRGCPQTMLPCIYAPLFFFWERFI